MPQYRRWFIPGATYFFTVVTHERRPILTTGLGRSCLRRAFLEVKHDRPFDLFAIVLLPDHLHTIWILSPGEADYSSRWARIKDRFTRLYLAEGGEEGRSTDPRARHRERAVWQRRFWEHTCRDEEDLLRCTDYLHWNPVKHGLVMKVKDHPWSSFHRFVKSGGYDLDWGGTNPCPGFVTEDWE
jgi:putative transposase